jgi:hypothetical protein
MWVATEHQKYLTQKEAVAHASQRLDTVTIQIDRPV